MTKPSGNVNFIAAKGETYGHEAGDYKGTDPDDRNPTRKGVIQTTYDNYRGSKILPKQSVFLATDEEIDEIYYQFWQAAHCDDLPLLVAIPCFDMAINAGPKRAIAIFQQSAGFAGNPTTYSGDCDGVWGSKTMAAAYIARQDERRWANRLQTSRLAFYTDIADKPSEINELRSWVRRVVAFNRKFLS